MTVGSKRKPRWFDIRDELSAPTVVYVKWRDERERERDGQTKYEPRIIRANTTTDADGGENDFRGNRSRGNYSEGKQGERDKGFIW